MTEASRVGSPSEECPGNGEVHQAKVLEVNCIHRRKETCETGEGSSDSEAGNHWEIRSDGEEEGRLADES